MRAPSFRPKLPVQCPKCGWHGLRVFVAQPCPKCDWWRPQVTVHRT